MAVEEGHHLSLFPPPLVRNREYRERMNTIEDIGNTYNSNTTPMAYGILTPLSATTVTTTDNQLPMSSAINNFVPVKAINSALTYTSSTFPVSRKRSIDFINPLLSFPIPHNQTGDDVSLHIRQQQLDMDSFVAQHAEKVRMEIEKRRKQNYSRRIIAAMEEGIRKRMRVKEEQIEKMGSLNWALEEKVKSLCMENQIWREVAQTNEATANNLRCYLEQVLAQQQQQQHHGCVGGGGVEEEESCCGSNIITVIYGEEEEVEKGGGEKKVQSRNRDNNNNRWCRKCGKEEACVVVLPCRHLCLCSGCESSLYTCPICFSSKNAILHLNPSS